MAFMLNKRGERVQVDMEVDWFSQSIVLYDDSAELKDCYILNLYKRETSADADQPELIKQKVYKDSPPTKEQVMYEMWKSELSRWDIATIEKGFILDW